MTDKQLLEQEPLIPITEVGMLLPLKPAPVAWVYRATEWLLGLPKIPPNAPYFINGVFKNDCHELAELLQTIPPLTAPVQEPYGHVTVVRNPGCAEQHWFYRWPEPPYLDNAAECHTVYTTPPAAPVQYELSPTDIYDFAGWLTTRKGVMKVGSSCEAGPMAEAVGEYLKTFPDRFTAAQRQWIGLTDEEMKHMLELFVILPHHVEMVVQAIEAKLKEKNT